VLPWPTEAVSVENNEALPCSNELNPVWNPLKLVKYVLGIDKESPRNPPFKNGEACAAFDNELPDELES
jgi:hypothetical protein